APLLLFFQAEDGIRGQLVTGVQTCALPISGRAPPTSATRPGSRDRPRPCRSRARATKWRRDKGSGPPSGPPRSAFAARAPASRRSEERRVGKEDRGVGCAALGA